MTYRMSASVSSSALADRLNSTINAASSTATIRHPRCCRDPARMSFIPRSLFDCRQTPASDSPSAEQSRPPISGEDRDQQRGNIEAMTSPHRTRDDGAELDDDAVVNRDRLGDAALVTGHLRLEPGEANFSQLVGIDVLRQRMVFQQRNHLHLALSADRCERGVLLAPGRAGDR